MMRPVMQLCQILAISMALMGLMLVPLRSETISRTLGEGHFLGGGVTHHRGIEKRRPNQGELWRVVQIKPDTFDPLRPAQ